MNFALSFRPIFIWLFVISGVNLDKTKRKWGLYFSIIVCLFWTVCIRMPYYSYNIYEGIMHVDPDNTSPIFTLSYRIHRIMGGVLQIAIAVALIYSYLGKWKSFWEKLQQLEDAIGDEGAFYRQLQREITAGLALVFLVSQHFFY